MFSDKPVTRAQNEARRIPNIASLSGPYFAAYDSSGDLKKSNPNDKTRCNQSKHRDILFKVICYEKENRSDIEPISRIKYSSK